MKKAVLVAIILGSSLLVLGGAAVGIGVALGSKSKFVTNEVALAEFQNIDAKLVTSDFEVVPSSDGERKIVLYEEEKYPHTVEVKDNCLYLAMEETRPWYDFTFPWLWKAPKATLYLPTGDYGQLNFNSTTGNAVVPSGYSFDSANLNLTTGNVEFSSSVDALLSITTTTGKISVRNTQCGAATLNVSTGNISLNEVEVSGAIKVNKTTGNIDCNRLKSESFTAESTTGNLLFTDSVIANHLAAKTSTGNIEFVRSDADTLSLCTTTGNIGGSLLTSKIFSVSTGTGKVEVPTSVTGGLCEARTETGNIHFTVVS